MAPINHEFKAIRLRTSYVQVTKPAMPKSKYSPNRNPDAQSRQNAGTAIMKHLRIVTPPGP
jgi:hypothetical protein